MFLPCRPCCGGGGPSLPCSCDCDCVLTVEVEGQVVLDGNADYGPSPASPECDHYVLCVSDNQDSASLSLGYNKIFTQGYTALSCDSGLSKWLLESWRFVGAWNDTTCEPFSVSYYTEYYEWSCGEEFGCPSGAPALVEVVRQEEGPIEWRELPCYASAPVISIACNPFP